MIQKRYIIFSIILGLIMVPAFLFTQSYAQTAEDSSLEQLSPEELQLLEETIKNVQESASINQYAPSGNDFQLDVVWGANTLTPYDYPGKALPGALSQMTFYAVADTPNPQDLVYTWLIDDASASNSEGPEQVGRGRDIFNFITFQIPQYTHRMRVVAQDPKTEKSATVALEIQTVMPEAYFYLEKNNSYGQAESNIIKLSQNSENNMMVRVFNMNSLNINSVDFKWSLNNTAKENSGTLPEIIPLNVQEGIPVGSQANLKLEVVNKRDKSGDLSQKAVTRASIYITK